MDLHRRNLLTFSGNDSLTSELLIEVEMLNVFIMG